MKIGYFLLLQKVGEFANSYSDAKVKCPCLWSKTCFCS